MIWLKMYCLIGCIVSYIAQYKLYKETGFQHDDFSEIATYVVIGYIFGAVWPVTIIVFIQKWDKGWW